MKAIFRAQNLFATPLLVGKLEDPTLNRELEELILANRAVDEGIRRSNVGGWHSKPDMLQWGGQPMARLMEQVLALADKHTMLVAGDDTKLGWGIEAWANINEQGSSNARHVHGGCYWSAVYYVRVDEGKGGELVLHDTRMPLLAMHAPRLRFRVPGGERMVRIKPQPGRLLIFPSWLPHEVESWDGGGMRISIAINLTATRPPQKGRSLKLAGGVAKAPVASPQRLAGQQKKDRQ